MTINFSSGKKRKSAFFFVFGAWWFVWMLLQTMVLSDFGLATSRAFTDSFISHALMAGMSLLVINNMRYYLPRREKYLYVLIITFTLSLLWLLLLRLCLWWLYKNDTAYMQLLNKTINIRYALAFLMTGVMTMLSLIWFTQKDQENDIRRKQDTEQLAREAELKKLRQQLQPHFLFNSLNSISALTGTQPEKARHMIQQLSDFLRGTLKKDDQQSTTFEEELQYLHLYLEIEKVRFGYRLETKITHDDEALQMKLPAMLLQPLVENAIKFGLYDTIGEVIILIAASNNNGMLEVTVANPFDELTAAPVKGTGFGLSSIRRRLFLLFGRHDLLQIKKEGQQFITKIIIPQTA